MAGKNPKEGERLRRLREVLGFNSSQDFAHQLGISAQRWNNVENGLPISKDVAFKIVRKYPWVTLDYVFIAKADDLPASKVAALSEPPKGDDKPPPRRR